MIYSRSSNDAAMFKELQIQGSPWFHFLADQYHLEIAPGTWDGDAMSIVGASHNLKIP
jgi:hypothetical protein